MQAKLDTIQRAAGQLMLSLAGEPIEATAVRDDVEALVCRLAAKRQLIACTEESLACTVESLACAEKSAACTAAE